jgi:hypothetical protein
MPPGTKIRTQLSRPARPAHHTMPAQCALSASSVPFVCSLLHEAVSYQAVSFQVDEARCLAVSSELAYGCQT